MGFAEYDRKVYLYTMESPYNPWTICSSFNMSLCLFYNKDVQATRSGNNLKKYKTVLTEDIDGPSFDRRTIVGNRT